MHSLILLLKEKGVELLLGGLIGLVLGNVPALVGTNPNTSLVIAFAIAFLLVVHLWIRN